MRSAPQSLDPLLRQLFPDARVYAMEPKIRHRPRRGRITGEATASQIRAEAEALECPEAYLRRCWQRFSLLSLTEERQLFNTLQNARSQAEFEQARQQIILSNLRLVMWTARKYRSRGLPLEDLCMEGVLGLMRAVKRFDPSMGVKFSTYASWWIRQSITRALAEKGALIRLPVHVQENLSRLRKAWLAGVSDSEEISTQAGKMHLPPEVLIDMLRGESGISSFESLCAELPPQQEAEPWYESETPAAALFVSEPLTRGECWPVSTFSTPEALVDVQAETDWLWQLLDLLDEREFEVLSRRFGLFDGAEWTLEMVGQHFGVSRERIRQIEKRALETLRARAKSQKGGSQAKPAPAAAPLRPAAQQLKLKAKKIYRQCDSCL